jgi:septal ring factor EnvC (AmiA/AmiB activator)
MQATRRAWIELSDAAHRARMQERERELEAQKAALAREAARKKAAAAEEKRKRDEEARAAQIRKKQEEEERRKATMKKCMSVFLEALETEMAACNKTWSKSPQGFNQEAKVPIRGLQFAVLNCSCKEKRDSKISVDRKQDRVKPTRSQTMI